MRGEKTARTSRERSAFHLSSTPVPSPKSQTLLAIQVADVSSASLLSRERKATMCGRGLAVHLPFSLADCLPGFVGDVEM